MGKDEAMTALVRELDALYEKATKGPWQAGHPLAASYEHWGISQPEFQCAIPADIKDSRWIAEFHNAFPALLARIEADREDAEWYQWLRDNAILEDLYDLRGTGPSSWDWVIRIPTGESGGVKPKKLIPFDEAIGAARKERK